MRCRSVRRLLAFISIKEKAAGPLGYSDELSRALYGFDVFAIPAGTNDEGAGPP